MAAIAEVLRHEDYKILGDQREPGREFPTTRVTVTITKGGRQIPDVPFLVVQTDKGRVAGRAGRSGEDHASQ